MRIRNVIRELLWGFVLGLIIFGVPILIIDLFRLWPWFGISDNFYYFRTLWALLRLAWVLIVGE